MTPNPTFGLTREERARLEPKPPFPPEVALDIAEAHRALRGMDPFDHAETCPRRTAATCAVGIECAHGYDVCPVCDPCNCKETC